MKKVILLLLSIAMLGFYSCTKDEDDTTDTTDKTDTTDTTGTTEFTNYVSIDGVKTELTQDVTVLEGLYYMVDTTTAVNDTTYLNLWQLYIADEALIFDGSSLSGAFNGLYLELLAENTDSPAAGTYVANQDGAGIIPSYTTAYYVNGYDFDAAGTLEDITGNNSVMVSVSGENTTITFRGTNESGNVLEYSYTADLTIVSASKKAAKELKF